MSEVDLTNPIFHDEDKAREHFEKLGWPNGPFCPHCGETEKVYRLNGQSHRPGLLHCNSCEQAFTITVGGIMERSHIPLTKWALGFHLMAYGKNGVSAKQLQRQLCLGYRTAWFMAHRIRTAMTPARRPARRRGQGSGKRASIRLRQSQDRPQAQAGLAQKNTPFMCLLSAGAS